MGKLTRKYVECIEECKYIERGTLCGVCGKKLGFFYDGFWSVNSKDRHLIDGVLCGKCHGYFKELIQDKKWVSNEVKKQQQWKKFTSLISESYTAADIKWFFEQKENSDKENLSSYGSEASGLFRIINAFQIDPHPLQVGIVRAKKLKNKMVVFGKAEEGIFRKKDKVKLDIGGNITETTVLEAFVFDPEAFIKHDMYADFNDTIAANLRYTRKIKENKIGWLILDVGLLGVVEGDRVIKYNL
jgi:hypothetical protein